MKLKAILFDLDGVLRDSREVLYPAFEHTLKKYTGNVPSREEMIPHIHHEDEVHKAFAADVPREEFVAMYHEKIAEFRPNTKLYDGALSTLTEIHAMGYKFGLVSHATTSTIFLTKHGLIDLFSANLNIKDMKERKPSPLPVLQTLELLNVGPQEAIMVGDLPTDIKAAVGANLKAAIGITHGFGDEKNLRAAGATHIIDSLSELSKVIKDIEAIK
jgi:HAD superfamily hydrolase (TIGR01509 family)